MATARGFSARQGHFDGFCGLYSIVNAVALMSESTIDAEGLMAAMIDHLEQRRELADTFKHGATRYRMVRLLGAARAYCKAQGHSLRWSKPMIARPHPPAKALRIDDIWRLLEDHQQRVGDGAIILGLNGRLLHWSCVRRVSSRSLAMFDSGNVNHLSLARIDRRLCTSGRPTRDRPHTIEEAVMLHLD